MRRTRRGVAAPWRPALLALLFAAASAGQPQQIFLHYDYMVLADQGTPCGTNADCNAGQSCTANVCRGHSHKPQERGIQAVVDAFAARASCCTSTPSTRRSRSGR